MPRLMRARVVSVCPRCSEKIHRGTLILPDFEYRAHAHKDCILKGRPSWGAPKGGHGEVQGGGVRQDVQRRGSAEQPPDDDGSAQAAGPGT